MEVHTSVRFKRNKAKGPNPLSAKKKTRRTPSGPEERARDGGRNRPHAGEGAAGDGGAADDEGGERQRKKPARKRRRGGGTTAIDS